MSSENGIINQLRKENKKLRRQIANLRSAFVMVTWQLDTPQRRPGVYVMLGCGGSEVVYVGQSRDVASRVAERELIADRVSFIPCESKGSRDALERALILALNPRANFYHTPAESDWVEVDKPSGYGARAGSGDMAGQYSAALNGKWEGVRWRFA